MASSSERARELGEEKEQELAETDCAAANGLYMADCSSVLLSSRERSTQNRRFVGGPCREHLWSLNYASLLSERNMNLRACERNTLRNLFGFTKGKQDCRRPFAGCVPKNKSKCAGSGGGLEVAGTSRAPADGRSSGWSSHSSEASYAGSWSSSLSNIPASASSATVSRSSNTRSGHTDTGAAESCRNYCVNAGCACSVRKSWRAAKSASASARTCVSTSGGSSKGRQPPGTLADGMA